VGALYDPQWGPGEPRPKANLVHSKAARKPLVAIILNILSTIFTAGRSKFGIS